MKTTAATGVAGHVVQCITVKPDLQQKPFTSIFSPTYTQWLIRSKSSISKPLCLKVLQKKKNIPVIANINNAKNN